MNRLDASPVFSTDRFIQTNSHTDNSQSSGFRTLEQQRLTELFLELPGFKELAIQEQNFLGAMTLRNLGHFFGSRWTKAVQDRFKVPLELCSECAEPFQFLLHGIDLLAYRGLLDSTLSNASERLRAFFPLFEQFDALQRSVLQSKEVVEQAQALQKWMEIVQERLQALAPGQELLLPWKRAHHHMGLLLFTRKEGCWELCLIDTGKGMVLHQTDDGNKKRLCNAIMHYTFPDTLKEVWREYLEIFFETPFYNGRCPGVEEFYALLDPFIDSGCTPVLKNAPQSKSSSIRSFGIAFQLFGGDWRRLKLALAEEVIGLGCHYRAPFQMADPLYLPFFDRILKNTFRAVNKQKIEKETLRSHIERLEQYEADLSHFHPSPTSIPFPNLTVEGNWLNKEILEQLKAARNDEKKKNREPFNCYPKPIFLFSLETVTLQELQSSLKALYSDFLLYENRYCCDAIEPNARAIETFRQLIQLFLSPRWKEQKASLLAELLEKPEEKVEATAAEGVFAELPFSKLDDQAFQNRDGKGEEESAGVVKKITTFRHILTGVALKVDWPLHLPAMHLVLEGIRLVAWQLIELEEEVAGVLPEARLTRYALSAEHLQAFEAVPRNLLSLAAWFSVEDELALLKESYRTLFAEGKQELFPMAAFTEPGNKGPVYRLGDPECLFLAPLVKKLSTEEIQTAQAHFQELERGDHFRSEVKPEVWQLHWLLSQQKAPIYFYELWQLTVALFVSSVGRHKYDLHSCCNSNKRSPFPSYRSIEGGHKGELAFSLLFQGGGDSPDPIPLYGLNKGTKISFYPSPESDKLPVSKGPQNPRLIAHALHWHEAVSILAAERPDVQIALLLETYGSQPELLTQKEHRLLMGMVLTTPRLLLQALRTVPERIEELFDFFKTRLDRKDRELARVSLDSQDEVECFLLHRWLYTATVCREIDLIRGQKEVDRVSAEVMRRLTDAKKPPLIQWQLELAALLCIPITEELSRESLSKLLMQIRSLFRTISLLESRHNELELPVHIFYEALARWHYPLKNVFENLLDEELFCTLFPEQRFEKMVKDKYPWVTLDSTESHFSFNFVTGGIAFWVEMLQPGAHLPRSFLYTYPVYSKLIGYLEHDLAPQDVHVLEVRKFLVEGKIEIVVQADKGDAQYLFSLEQGEMTISRDFEGRSYHLLMHSQPHFEGQLCWQSAEEEGWLLWERTAKGPTGKIDSKGWFHPISHPGRRERFSGAVTHTHPLFLKKPTPFFTEYVDGSAEATQLLTFPAMRYGEGEQLQLIRDGERWCLSSNPLYAISEEQRSVELNLFGLWFLLETDRGEQMLLVPNCIYEELKGNDKFQVLLLELDRSGKLVPQKSIQGNLLIAYYLMHEARMVADYERASLFLQLAYPFRRYSDAEAALLAKIADDFESREGMSPECCAIRLFATCLLKDNFSQYPQRRGEQVQRRPSPRASDLEWSCWAETLQEALFQEGERSGREMRCYEQKSILEKAHLSYLSNRNNLHSSLRLEKFFRKEILADYGLYSEWETFVSPEVSIRKTLKEVSFSFRYSFELPVKKILQGTDRKTLGSQMSPKHPLTFEFLRLMKEALSPDEVLRNKVLQRLRTTVWDSKDCNEHRSLFIYLLALIASSDPHHLGHKTALALTKKFKESVTQAIEAPQQDEVQFYDPDSCFLEFSREYCNKSSPPQAVKRMLPFTLRQEKIPLARYQPNLTLYRPFEELALALFSSSPRDLALESVHFEQRGIDCSWLNAEVAIGAAWNSRDRDPQSSCTLESVEKALFSTGYEQIREWREADLGEEKRLVEEILERGNRGLLQTLEGRLLRGGGHRTPFTLRDLLLLCCEGDRLRALKELCLDWQAWDALVQQIGCLCEVALRERHAKHILEQIDELKSNCDPNCRQLLISEIRRELLEPYRVVEGGRLTALVLLCYQHLLQINLRADQLDKLSDLLNAPHGHILQMATGEGKSSVLAPLLLFAAADGDQLAILLSPEHQFNAILPTVGKRAYEGLRQKQYAFIFEDHPPYSTNSHLKKLLKMVLQVRKEGGFLHTTPLSLRALRTAYLQGQLDAHNPDLQLSSRQLEALKANNDLLETLLILLRRKGSFVVDEIDEAADARKVYNKGVGRRSNLDAVEIELMQEVVAETIRLRGEDGTLLIPFKDASRPLVDLEQAKKLTRHLAHHFLHHSIWLQRFGCEELSPKEVAAVADYLCDIQAAAPASLRPLLLEGGGKLERLAFLRDLLAGRGLFGSIEQRFFEDYLLEPNSSQPIAVPTRSHMHVAEQSEFSDPYRMALNTFYGYYMMGISHKQTEELIAFLRHRATQELSSSPENECPTLRETKTCQAFSSLAQTFQFPHDLFAREVGESATQKKIHHALNSGHLQILPLLLPFISEEILLKKKLYTKEVPCTGMAMFLLGKKVSGFTATLDQPLIAPCLDVARSWVTCATTDGIFGKKIDLLLCHHNTLYIIGEEPIHLFSDLLMKMEPEKQQRVRAIMDGGCHFRGMDNRSVAQMICQQLQLIPTLKSLQGVLFFDLESNCPLYMKMSGEVREMDSLETEKRAGKRVYRDIEVAIEDIFVLFSSDKVIGTDVPLPDEAVVLSTMPSKSSAGKSPFFIKIQAVGRARGLEKRQEVITAVPKSLVTAMADRLNDFSLRGLDIGQVTEGRELLKKLFVYVWGHHLSQKQEEGRLLTIHQLLALVQQTLLDAAYLDPNVQSQLFTNHRFLFEEQVVVNFIERVGLPWQEISLPLYWKKVIQAFVPSIRSLLFPQRADALIETLEEIVERANRFLPDRISLPPQEVAPDKPLLPHTNLSGDGLMVQVQSLQQEGVQEQTSLYNRVNIRERARNEKLKTDSAGRVAQLTKATLFAKAFASFKAANRWHGLRFSKYEPGRLIESSFAESIFSFLFEKKVHLALAPVGKCYSLDTLLHQKLGSKWPSRLFSRALMLSDGFLETVSGEVNLLDFYQKPIQLLLLIRDREKPAENSRCSPFRMVLLPIDQAEAVAKHLTKAKMALDSGEPLPMEQREMWLITPHGVLAAPSPYPYDKEALFQETGLRYLLVQLYLFMGDLKTLESPKWHPELQRWMATTKREPVRELFESLLQSTEGYLQSKTFALLQVTPYQDQDQD